MGHGHRGRVALWLQPVVRGVARQPGGDGGAVPVFTAGHRHRQGLGAVVPRTLQPALRAHAMGAGGNFDHRHRPGRSPWLRPGVPPASVDGNLEVTSSLPS